MTQDEHRMQESEDRVRRSLWREIFGTVIGSLPLATAVFVWGVSLETRLTRHDTKIEVLEKKDDAFDKRADAVESSLNRRLDRIDDKLDKALANQAAAATIARPVQIAPGVWRDGRDLNR